MNTKMIWREMSTFHSTMGNHLERSRSFNWGILVRMREKLKDSSKTFNVATVNRRSEDIASDGSNSNAAGAASRLIHKITNGKERLLNFIGCIETINQILNAWQSD